MKRDPFPGIRPLAVRKTTEEQVFSGMIGEAATAIANSKRKRRGQCTRPSAFDRLPEEQKEGALADAEAAVRAALYVLSKYPDHLSQITTKYMKDGRGL